MRRQPIEQSICPQNNNNNLYLQQKKQQQQQLLSAKVNDETAAYRTIYLSSKHQQQPYSFR